MEEMGCGFKWLFVDDDLRSTPSVKAGISSSQEQTFRTKMAMLIQTIGSKSRLTQLAMNTSVIFMHRFFMYRTVRQFPRLHLAVAFAFAGGKVEESFCKLEHLVRSAVDVIRSNKNREFLDKSDPLTYEMDCLWRSKMEALLHSNCSTDSQAYQDMRKIILECEAEIYAVIGFNLSIIHPHNFVVKMCSLLGSENTKDISHYAYNLATASSQLTMLCLKYKPEFIAVMCLSIAAKAHNVEFRRLQDGKNWYQAFDESVVLSDVEAVSREFVNLAKGYPFWKDANGQQVFLNRRIPSGQSRSQSSAPQTPRQQAPHSVHSTPQSNASVASSHVLPANAGMGSASRQSSTIHFPTPQDGMVPSDLVQINYPMGGSAGTTLSRQNTGDLGNGRSGSSGATSISRDQTHSSRSHQRSLHQHGMLSQSAQQQAHQVPHHQHHSQHHHHHQHQHYQQQPHHPVAAAPITNTSRPSTVSASQPEDTVSLGRQSHPMSGGSQAIATQPQPLHHHGGSSSSLSHAASSSSSRDLPPSQPPLLPEDASRQAPRPPRSLSEQGRQRQQAHPAPPDMARAQSLHHPRQDQGMRPGEPGVTDSRHRAHRSAPVGQPSLAHHQQLQQNALASDHSRPQQQQQLLASRQSQAALQRQQAHIAQQQQQLGHRQQPHPVSGQHYQQQDRLVPTAQQHSNLLHAQHQQQSHIVPDPRLAGELSPHTPPLPYPSHLDNSPLVSQPSAAPVSVPAARTLPGSGDAPQVAIGTMSRQLLRNSQNQSGKDAPSHAADGLSSRAPNSSHQESYRSGSQSKPMPTEGKTEPSTSSSLLNDRVLKIKLEPCSSSPVQNAAKIKCEPLPSSPADEKVLASSNFTKPQDSPSNPRIKIKVKRESSSSERHSVKYADSGLKIKIKPPKPEGDVEAGPSVSGHSSRSSTPREEGEVEGTPSPASSTSSGRKSEGLRIRLSVPKPDGSSSGGGKRDNEQWPNGVGAERDSSSGHRSHHHGHHHGRHHKSKKHSKHSRHEKSSSKRSASGDVGEDRPSKSSRTESSSSGLQPSLSLQTGGYPGLASTSSSSNSLGGFTTSDNLHQGGFSITDAFSTTMPNDIFDDDDEDTLPSIPLTPVEALPQVPSHHERFQQMMNQHNANGSQGSSGS